MELSQARTVMLFQNIRDELAKADKWMVLAENDKFLCFRDGMKKEDWIICDSLEELNGFLCGVIATKKQFEFTAAPAQASVTAEKEYIVDHPIPCDNKNRAL